MDNIHFEFRPGYGPISLIELVLTQDVTALREARLAEDALDEVIPVRFDFYILSGSDPTVTDVPGLYLKSLHETQNECLWDIGGKLVCRKEGIGDPVRVRLAEEGQAPLFKRGEGCIKIYWSNGSPLTTVDDIAVVTPAIANPGGSCP